MLKIKTYLLILQFNSILCCDILFLKINLKVGETGFMIRLCAFSDEAATDLDGQIDALTRNGITLTELRSVDGKNVSEFSESQAAKICAALRASGISVWSVGSPLGKTDLTVSDAEWEQSVKRICGIANALQTDKIRAFSFYGAYGQGARVIERLNFAARIARTFGVTLYHENEKDVYGDTLERVTELMNNLEGWEFVYDPANYIQVGEKAEDTLAVAKRCSYYHIKDVIANTGELVPAGEGDGKIAELIKLINKNTVLTIEPHLAVFEGYAAIDNTEMKHRHAYGSNMQAFDAAVAATKGLLTQCRYKYKDGGYNN